MIAAISVEVWHFRNFMLVAYTEIPNWNIVFNNLRNYHILFSGRTTWELPSLCHYLSCLLELVCHADCNYLPQLFDDKGLALF